MVSWSSRWRTNHRWWIAQSPPSARSCHFSRSGKWHVSWQLYTEFLVGSQWRLSEAFPIPFIWLHANQPPVHCSGCLRTNKRLLIFSVLCLSVYFSSNCLLNNSHSGCAGGGVSCSLSLSVVVAFSILVALLLQLYQFDWEKVVVARTAWRWVYFLWFYGCFV